MSSPSKTYYLYPSELATKKWRIETPSGKSVNFGAEGYEDYTMHKDKERMERYVARHSRGNENHLKSGINTAGFWSRWLLWSEPSIPKAIRLIEKKFGIHIVRKR
jgi:hypothetical protein